MTPSRATVGLAANILAFLTSLVVNVLLAPFLVSRLGEEAFGFISLINGFASVAAVISTSLNLMAGRYVSLCIHRGELDQARRYLSSTVAANVVLSGAYLLLLVPGLIHLDLFVSVSPRLKVDVQWALALVVVSFIVTSVMNVFAAGAIVHNRVDLIGWRDIAGHLARVSTVLALFLLLPPNIHFIVVGSVVGAVVTACINVWLARRLLPAGFFQFGMIGARTAFALLAAGGLYMVNGLSGYLMNDATLLLVNRGLGGHSMGLLAIARIVPVNILTLAAVISATFTPRMIGFVGALETEGLGNSVREAMTVVAIIVGVPFAGYVAFGRSFLRLWLPTMNETDLDHVYILSTVLVVGCAADALTAPLFPLFVATGRMRFPTAVALTFGVGSIFLISSMMRTLDYGLMGVVVVVSSLTILRVLVVLPIYSARLLSARVGTVFVTLLKSLGVGLLLFAIFCGVESAISVNSWAKLLLVTGTSGCIGWVLSFLLMQRRLPRPRM